MYLPCAAVTILAMARAETSGRTDRLHVNLTMIQGFAGDQFWNPLADEFNSTQLWSEPRETAQERGRDEERGKHEHRDVGRALRSACV